MIWFVSDTHFSHRRISLYCGRPFDTIEAHDEQLIQNWNGCVKLQDSVYHLGDFCFGKPEYIEKIRKRLNGRIYLILGNHDKKVHKTINCFEWIKDYFRLIIDNQDIILFHYAMVVWEKSHYSSWALCGHSHSTLTPWINQHLPNSKIMDVGVDAVAKRLAGNEVVRPEDYRPISYDEVKAIMATKVWRPIDQHDGEKKT